MEILVFLAITLGLVGCLSLVIVVRMSGFVLQIANRVKEVEDKMRQMEADFGKVAENSDFIRRRISGATGLIDLPAAPGNYDPRFSPPQN
jgi:hypothetical protein